MEHAALDLQSVTKYFGRFKAVDDLSLKIGNGEVFTLLGPSGCGKTTTLRLIAGLEVPDEGTILLHGKPIVSMEKDLFVPTHRRNMGMVFQSYAIWPHKTVFENVAFPLRVRRVKDAEIRQRVSRALELVELAGLEQRPAPQLSGGQQQRVAIARALVYEPSVLLLDEPFSNLDAKLREQMRMQIKLLLDKIKITAVFVTHDQTEALSLSSRIAVMNQGRVEQIGSPLELYVRPATPFVRDFLGRTVLLRGSVLDLTSGGSASIRLDAVPDSALKVHVSSEDVAQSGQSVLIAVRPEDIELRLNGSGPSAANELGGTVESLLFVGNHYECRVRIGAGESLYLHAPRSARLTQGQVIRMHISPEGVSVWPS